MSGAKGLTKSQLVSLLAEKTEFKASEIKRVFEALADIAKAEIKKGNNVTIPDLVKIKVKTKKASNITPRFMNNLFIFSVVFVVMPIQWL